MRLSITLPDELGKEAKRCAQEVSGGNVSRFIADAVKARLQDLRKRESLNRLQEAFDAAAGEEVPADIHERIRAERRAEDAGEKGGSDGGP